MSGGDEQRNYWREEKSSRFQSKFSAFSEQDEKDIIEFELKRRIDIIAASFIRKGSDIEDIRGLIGIKGSYVKIIAKIENREEFEYFDDILDKADGIMVARGDLGIELPTEKVF